MSRYLSTLMLIALLLLAACSDQPAVDEELDPVPAGSSATSTPVAAFGFPTVAPLTSPAGRPTAEPEPTPEPRAIYTVQRGTVVDELTFTGRVAPVQLPLAFVEDGVLARLLVTAGTQVEAGQLLAELDLGEFAGQLRQAQVNYSQEQVALEQAVEMGRLMVEEAQIGVDEAQKHLAEVSEPPAPAEFARAEAELWQAETNLATTQNNYSAEKNLAEQEMHLAARMLELAQQRYARALNAYQVGPRGSTREERREEEAELQAALDEAETAMREAESRVAVAKITYDTAVNNEIAAVEEARSRVYAAEARIAELRDMPDPFVIAAAEREVQRATITLREAQQLARPDPNLVKRVAAGQAEIERIQSLIEGRRIYAPFAGEVVGIDGSVGLPVRAGTPLIVLVDNSRMEILASVNGGREIGRLNTAQINVGQPVEVVFSRYSDQTIDGNVTRVPAAATGATLGTTYHISYDAAELELEVGDLADLTMILGRKQNVLWLPADAVTLSDRPAVTIREDGEERRVDIEIGLTTAERVEILSGLEENDVVVVR